MIPKKKKKEKANESVRMPVNLLTSKRKIKQHHYLHSVKSFIRASETNVLKV